MASSANSGKRSVKFFHEPRPQGSGPSGIRRRRSRSLAVASHGEESSKVPNRYWCRAGIAACVAGVLVACATVVRSLAVGTTRPSSPDTADVQKALVDLREGRLAEAEREAMEIAARSGDESHRAWLIVAAARQRCGRHAAAVRAYRLYLASSTSTALRQYVLKQMQTCRAELTEPAKLAPLSKRLTDEERRRLEQRSDRMFTESGDHFVVRARNAALAGLLVGEAERHLRRICRDVLAGQEYPHSVDIWVWSDHEDYLAHAIDAPDWSGGHFSFKVEDGVVTRRIDLTQLDKDGRLATIMLDRVLPHEMCHLVVHEFFGDVRCPLFLDEGLAMLAEEHSDNKRTELAAAALRGEGKMPLDELLVRLRHNMGDPETFYAESLSFTRFLRARITHSQFRAFLEHVKDGCTVADAIQRALFMPHLERFLPDLADAWENHAAAEAQFIHELRDGK